jgi:hypothetical protein
MGEGRKAMKNRQHSENLQKALTEIDRHRYSRRMKMAPLLEHRPNWETMLITVRAVLPEWLLQRGSHTPKKYKDVLRDAVQKRHIRFAINIETISKTQRLILGSTVPPGKRDQDGFYREDFRFFPPSSLMPRLAAHIHEEIERAVSCETLGEAYTDEELGKKP